MLNKQWIVIYHYLSPLESHTYLNGSIKDSKYSKTGNFRSSSKGIRLIYGIKKTYF